jgi:hypothetical protein
MVISDLVVVVSGIATLANIGALFLVYRKFAELSGVAVEFAGLVAASISEEDGELVGNPESIVGMAVEHMERLRGLLKW